MCECVWACECVCVCVYVCVSEDVYRCGCQEVSYTFLLLEVSMHSIQCTYLPEWILNGFQQINSQYDKRKV